MRVTLAGWAVVGVTLLGCCAANAADLDAAEAATESAMADALVQAAGSGKAALLTLQGDGNTPSPICYDRWQYVVAEALSRARTRPAQEALLSSLAGFNLFRTEPIPVLVALAKGPDLALRLQALHIVAGAGDSGGFAADAVRAGLADPDRRVQAAAAGALRYFQAPPPAMVAPLGQRLEDADQEVRRVVLDALANVKDANAALEGLLALLADREADLPSKRRAAVLLGRTGSARAVAPLAAMLEEANPATRRAAAEGLAGLAKRGRPAGLRGPLGKAEDDVDRETKVAGAEGLAALGHFDLALPTLRRMLFSHDGGASDEALRALGELGKAAAPAAPDLVSVAIALDDRNDDSARAFWELRQKKAIDVLKKLGPPAITATVRLLRPAAPTAHKDDDNDGEGDGDADGEGQARLRALYLLGELGPVAGAASGFVAKLAADRDEHVREAVARNLGKLASNKAAAARVIAKLVRDPKPGVRTGALEGLRELGPAAAPAAGAVAAALGNEDTIVAAADALAEIGKGASGAARLALTKAAGDSRIEVRGAVGYALVTTGVDPKRGLALVAEAFDAAPALNRYFPFRERRDAGSRLQAVVGRPDATESVLPAALRGLKSTDWGKQVRAATNPRPAGRPRRRRGAGDGRGAGRRAPALQRRARHGALPRDRELAFAHIGAGKRPGDDIQARAQRSLRQVADHRGQARARPRRHAETGLQGRMSLPVRRGQRRDQSAGRAAVRRAGGRA